MRFVRLFLWTVFASSVVLYGMEEERDQVLDAVRKWLALPPPEQGSEEGNDGPALEGQETEEVSRIPCLQRLYQHWASNASVVPATSRASSSSASTRCAQQRSNKGENQGRISSDLEVPAASRGKKKKKRKIRSSSVSSSSASTRCAQQRSKKEKNQEKRNLKQEEEERLLDGACRKNQVFEQTVQQLMTDLPYAEILLKTFRQKHLQKAEQNSTGIYYAQETHNGMNLYVMYDSSAWYLFAAMGNIHEKYCNQLLGSLQKKARQAKLPVVAPVPTCPGFTYLFSDERARAQCAFKHLIAALDKDGQSTTAGYRECEQLTKQDISVSFDQLMKKFLAHIQ